MSNTSSLLISLPVIFVLDRWGVGGGGRVRCFCLGISEGSYINPFQEVGGPRRFPPKNSKLPPPPPPPPIKNVPSLTNIGVLYSTALDFQTANYIPNMGRKWSSARVNSPHCRQQMIPSGKREWLGLKLQNHGVQFIITTKSSRIHFASQKIRKSL